MARPKPFPCGSRYDWHDRRNFSKITSCMSTGMPVLHPTTMTTFSLIASERVDSRADGDRRIRRAELHRVGEQVVEDLWTLRDRFDEWQFSGMLVTSLCPRTPPVGPWPSKLDEIADAGRFRFTSIRPASILAMSSSLIISRSDRPLLNVGQILVLRSPTPPLRWPCHGAVR